MLLTSVKLDFFGDEIGIVGWRYNWIVTNCVNKEGRKALMDWQSGMDFTYK